MRNQKNIEPEKTEDAPIEAGQATVRREQVLFFNEDTGYANNFGPRAHSALNRILKEFLREDNYPTDAMPTFSPDMQVVVSIEFR